MTLLDLGLPRDTAHMAPEQLYRMRFLVFLAILLFASACLRLVYPPYPLMSSLIFGLEICLAIGLGFALRQGLPLRPVATYALLSFILLESAQVYARGVLLSTFYIWIPLFAIASTYLTGARRGSFLGILSLTLVYLLTRVLEPSGLQLPEGETPQSFLASYQLQFVLAEILTVGIISIFAVLRKRTEEELGEQRLLRARTTRKAALAEVVGSLAHEINNPLAIIHASTLRYQRERDQGGVNKETRQLMHRHMREALQRIEHVADALQNFADGNDREPMQLIPLDRLVQQAMRQVQEKARSRGSTLESQLSETSIQVRCRPQQLVFVLGALLDNACDAVAAFGEDGRVELKVRKIKDRLRFEVYDNGPGLDVNVRERLFEPFVSSKLGRSTSGMALSVCRGILNEHGGRIGHAREQDQTRFWFELPEAPIAKGGRG